jgi:hypothetical protein
VEPPSTKSSTALTNEESLDARKSTALAISSASPQRPSGMVEAMRLAASPDSSAGRPLRAQIGVFVAPGATTLTRMLRGARSPAIERDIARMPALLAA